MYFHQFRLQDMGCATYLIGSETSKEAVIVDPTSRIEEYLQFAEENQLKISRIFETHLHADHVSSNRQLAHLTGAEIYLHKEAHAAYLHHALEGGEVFILGDDVRITIIYTPGHTWEMINLLVEDLTTGTEVAPKLLSGDTLFVGDVGRPDFAGEQGAGALYDSIQEKILLLPDNTEIFPAHLSGSLCGRNLSSAPMSLLKLEKKQNQALLQPSRTAFINFLTADLPERPADFKRIVELNRAGSPVELPELTQLTWEILQQQLREGVQLLDVRAPEQFQAKHIFGALNVPSKLGHFGAHVAAFMPYTTPVVLIATDKTEVNEARRALSLVGRYSVEGYILSQAIPPSVSFKEKGAITADVFMRDYYSKVALLDVRQPGEWLADHLYSAHNIPVRELPERLSEVELLVEQDKPLAIICGSGFRSSVAASFLEQKGWKQVLNVQGGMQGVRELKVEVGDRNEERWLKP